MTGKGTKERVNGWTPYPVLLGGKARGSGTRSESLSQKPGDRPWTKPPPPHPASPHWGGGVGYTDKPAEWPQLRPSPNSSGRGLPEPQTPGEASPGVLPRGVSPNPLRGQSWKDWSPEGHPRASRWVGWPPMGDQWPQEGHLCPASGGGPRPALPATGLCLQGQ